MLVASLASACGPTTEERCVETAWSLEIDDPRASWICDVQIAPDGGTIVLLGGAQSGPSFIEVESGGASWRVVDLPLPDHEFYVSYCASLVIDPSGDRWAIAVFDTESGREDYILRAPVHGEASLTPVTVPGVDAGGLSRLVSHGEVVRAAGWSKIDRGPADPAEYASLLGIIDPQTSTWIVEHHLPDLAGVHALVPAPQRIYALISEPSIDYAAAHVLAIEPTSGEIAWRRNAGVVGWTLDPKVIGLHPSDIAVAKHPSTRTTSIERIEATGRTLWKHEHEYEWGTAGATAVTAYSVVATPREIVSIVDLFDTSLDVSATHAEVVGLDGEQVCTSALEVPQASGQPRFTTAAGEQVVTAIRRSMAPEIVITALALPARL